MLNVFQGLFVPEIQIGFHELVFLSLLRKTTSFDLSGPRTLICHEYDILIVFTILNIFYLFQYLFVSLPLKTSKKSLSKMEKRIQEYSRMKGGKSKGPSSATLSIEGRKMNL